MTLRVRGLQVVSVALLLLVWEAAARAGWVDPLFIPAPSDGPDLRRQALLSTAPGLGLADPTAFQLQLGLKF